MKLEVEKILEEKDIKYRLIKLSQNAFTVEDVAKYSEGEVHTDETCKTMILRGRKSGKKIAILLRGNDKLDFKKVKKFFGEEMAIANGEQVKEAAGVEPGAVCPFLVKVPLFIEKRVMNLKRINCGSGNHLYGLELMNIDLIKKIDYQEADLASYL
jgi:prolyl-tRNA editing enzyme YbaK/EbsC (Cys-tRNA(Pro) deacylase)